MPFSPISLNMEMAGLISLPAGLAVPNKIIQVNVNLLLHNIGPHQGNISA
jgi:hypothetical protein